jgi:hypothetical protein
MKDEEATKLDWWLLNYLREKLFHPRENEAQEKRAMSDSVSVED